MDWDAQEQRRLELQASLDDRKSARARNQLGQFATPTALARDILTYGLTLLDRKEPIRFFDPAIGTGSFYSALLHAAGGRRIDHASGFEIDPHYGDPATELWRGTSLHMRHGDFTKAEPQGDGANLLICNPPYVRHHHLDTATKTALQDASQGASGVRIQGLAGLYCYFLALSHPWLTDGGIAGWLIPSEFMEVNYGVAVKRYLATKVTLLRIHRFDPRDVQFGDALVTSAVVWFRKTPPPKGHRVEFTFGGSLLAPYRTRHIALSDLDPSDKWTRYPQGDVAEASTALTIGDLFTIRRGIATGDNGFFVMSPQRAEALGIPPEFLRPILPGTRYVPGNEIPADAAGMPLIDRQLLLLDCSLPESEVRERFPKLWKYLQTGTEGEPSVSSRYLCRFRTPWYSQESRTPAPLLCTYMGRSGRNGRRPFRFFLNHSRAIAGNVYLMLYPKPLLQRQLQKHPDLLRRIWSFLNEVDPGVLIGEGRVYGGGLHKLEPKELAKVPLTAVAEQLPTLQPSEQLPLFSRQVA